ncbi:MAG: MFS transporter [Planctomycetaceae bacterium]
MFHGCMVGLGETYLPAFALAVGLGELTAGFVASLPQLAGGIMQLVSPRAIARLGSHRRWIVLCALVQAASFLPLVFAAFQGWISGIGVLLVATIYWGTGLAGGPAWNTWIGTIVPRTIRARYFSCRTRLNQAAILGGFLTGGFALQYGAALGTPLTAFAFLFLLAGICRLVSAWFLSRQSEPEPIPRNMRRIPPAEMFSRLCRGGEGRLLLYLSLVQGAAYFAGPYFAPFMIRELQLTYGQFVWLIAAAFVAKVVSLPLFGRLAAVWGARRLLWVGGIGIAPFAALWLVSNHIAWLTFVQLMAGTTWAAYELAVLLCYFESVKAEERTSMLTTFNLATTAAMVIGSLLGGALLKFLGPSASTYYLIFALSTVFRFATLLVLRTVPEILVAPRPVAVRTIGVDPTSGSISRPILQDMAIADFVTSEGAMSAIGEPVLLEVEALAEENAVVEEAFLARKSA